VKRNTPTLINALYQQSQFWDGRTAFLEDQISDVLQSPLEMHSSWDDVIPKLNEIDEYRKLFKAAVDADNISGKDVQVVMAAYIRTLKGINSQFDQYMRGDGTALNSRQINGFNLFMGKGKCATCHFLPLFNGTVPPTYSETEAEVIGVPRQVAVSNAKADDDRGKGATQMHPLFDRMFKTPTLRNVAITSPYMHNGAYESLEQVIEFYDLGGGAGIGNLLVNQTLPEARLNLTKEEQADLIAFLTSLTDTAGITSRPSFLPQGVGDLKIRKVGGIY
jgi:cytochrome c peroxidase